MKRLLFCLMLVGLSGISIAQYRYTIGLGVTNERNNGAMGGNLRFFFNFSPNFRMNIDYAHYDEIVEKEFNQSVSYDFREINLNFHYLIIMGEQERFSIYPLLGFNYTFGSEVVETPLDKNEQFQEDTGLNFGIGANYIFGRFTPFVESRSIISVNSYLLFTAGLTYSFGER